MDKPTTIILTAVITLVILGSALGAYIFFVPIVLAPQAENQNQQPAVQREEQQANIQPGRQEDSYAGWETYANEKYGFEIKYPLDWVYREYPDTKQGAGFRLKSSPDDVGSEVVNISLRSRPVNFQKVPFEDYVKEAASQEIEGFMSSASIEKVTTQSGLVGYRTTWNVSAHQTAGISGLITYFDTGDKAGDTVQITSGCGDDKKCAEVYNKMIMSFKFMN
jgi:hypothetical protein